MLKGFKSAPARMRACTGHLGRPRLFMPCKGKGRGRSLALHVSCLHRPRKPESIDWNAIVLGPPSSSSSPQPSASDQVLGEVLPRRAWGPITVQQIKGESDRYDRPASALIFRQGEGSDKSHMLALAGPVPLPPSYRSPCVLGRLLQIKLVFISLYMLSCLRDP